jgi:hypothetical protein
VTTESRNPISESRPPRLGLLIVILACVAGAVARFSSSRLPLFHDEAATLLAAQRIAETGLPRLPSGVLYLHGVVLSYLLAPLGWFGLLDIGNVENLRVVNVLIGVLAIPLAWLIGRKASGSEAVGVTAAVLVALDPASVLWGSYLRMYALLEVLAAVFILALLHAIDDSAGHRHRVALRWMVVAFWLAMFSQTLAALLLPAAAAVAVVLYGRDLLGARRDLAAALGACALAVVSYLALTRFGSAGGVASINATGGSRGVGFLGDDQLDFGRLIEPSVAVVIDNYQWKPFGEVIPFLLFGLVCVVVGRYLAEGAERGSRSDAAGVLVAFALVPILALVFLVNKAGQRYLMGAFVPLLTLTAWGLVLLRPGRMGSATSWMGWASRAATVGLIAVMLLGHDIWLLTHPRDWAPLRFGDQRAAVAAIAAERDPGDLVIGSFPVVMYQSLGREEGARFLNYTGLWAGPSPDGVPRDYWLGNPMVTSDLDLCETAAAHPGSFIVAADMQVDFWNDPLKPSPTFAIIKGAGKLLYRDTSARVYRIEPEKRWDDAAVQACRDAGLTEPAPTQERKTDGPKRGTSTPAASPEPRDREKSRQAVETPDATPDGGSTVTGTSVEEKQGRAEKTPKSEKPSRKKADSTPEP